MGAYKTMVCEGQIQYTDAVQQRLPLHIKGLPLHTKGLPLHIAFTFEGKRCMLQKENVVLGVWGGSGGSSLKNLITKKADEEVVRNSGLLRTQLPHCDIPKNAKKLSKMNN